MIPMLFVTVTFVAVVVVTWLSARAEATQSRCDDLTRHIHAQLEQPAPPADRQVGLRAPSSRR